MADPATEEAGSLVAQGRALGFSGHYGAALEKFDRALVQDSKHVAAWYYRGAALRNLDRHVDSLLAFDRAVALDPGFGRGWQSHADALSSLGEYDLARGSYSRAFEIDPHLHYLQGSWVAAKAAVCDWEGLVDAHRAISDAIGRGEHVALPGSLLATSLDGHVQRRCAELHVAHIGKPEAAALRTPKPPAGRRIRLAYVSADLRNHPVGYQVRALLRHHDRARFEIHIVSLRSSPDDPVQHEIREACDQFHDGSIDTDAALGLRVRSIGVDIAFDLQGYTTFARPRLFAHRIAPVQATLFCPGTSGSRSRDYVVADADVIPDPTEFTEAVALVPATHFVTDNSREALPAALPPPDEGLPSSGVVLACFNAAHKLDPETWALWMSLLRRLPDSVLWLGSSIPPAATARLRQAARGIRVDPDRLVFARRTRTRAEHLARHVHATVCLDTRWYNGHTTTADALWMGVPVVTWSGSAYCGRVSASLLAAADLQDLVAADSRGYLEIAQRFALDPEWGRTIRARLDDARSSGRLFDVARTTRGFESLYAKMVDRAASGGSPLPLASEPSASHRRSDSPPGN